jgi:hypothetical protein
MVIRAKNRRLTDFGIYVKQQLLALNWQQEDLVKILKQKGFVMYKSKLSALLHGSYNDKNGEVQKCIYEILKNANAGEDISNGTYAHSL